MLAFEVSCALNSSSSPSFSPAFRPPEDYAGPPPKGILMNGLLSPGFIFMNIYGVIGVCTWIMVIVIILKSGNYFTRSSFFKIFLVYAIVNLTIFFNKYPVVRLPYYTCMSCCLSNFFANANSVVFTIFHTIHWHLVHSQYMLGVVMAVDRVIILIGSYKVQRLWRKGHLVAVILVLVLPLVFSQWVIRGITFYSFEQQTNNYKINVVEVKGNEENTSFLYDSAYIDMLACSCITSCLNGYIYVAFGKGALKILTAQRRAEYRLFYNSVIEGIVALVTAILTILQRYFYGNVTFYNCLRIVLLLSHDAMALLPPFLLIWTSSSIRKSVKKILAHVFH